ncbi:ABC transporter ATP-binding protein [Kineococcus aurantiacus]|uniref:ABC-type multidrug transport system ATPase subunit n=1 Tax=Kineococcus aurantiacus TaxID=37633 RepID=A0A7Y9DJ00_9ACTN|nr:ABC transporter ATP-binding protein [Kineococcus aurantiacus]NYD21164.1 ABC-type multidrug transport system ATPase subunit [Kineococcus aurantiacus]
MSRTKARPGREVVLALQDLRVGYGEPVCAPVTVDVARGEALCLVGANGAGKSTVLRAVAGLLEPLGGSVQLHGQAVDERSVRFRREVACVFDEDAWFAELSVAEHLELVARGHGVRDVVEVVDAELEAQRLTDAADQLPTSLSSGQKRRLLLAAALVRPRSVLLLDEPEQRLDPTGREALADRLVAERDAGTALVLATHDVVLLRRLATRAVVVDDERCRVVDAEEAARIVSDPVR